jgi:hypothetical protein
MRNSKFFKKFSNFLRYFSWNYTIDSSAVGFGLDKRRRLTYLATRERYFLVPKIVSWLEWYMFKWRGVRKRYHEFYFYYLIPFLVVHEVRVGYFWEYLLFQPVGVFYSLSNDFRRF